MIKFIEIISFDISTHKIAIVKLCNDNFSTVELESPFPTWEERFEDLHFQFKDFAKSITKDVQIFIEEFPYVRNYQSLIKLVHFLSMIRTELLNVNRKCTYVNNTSWKKGVGLKGNATKNDIKEKAVEIFGAEKISPLSQDLIDSLMIGRYGQSFSKQ